METVGIYCAGESSALVESLQEGAKAAGLRVRLRSANDFRDGDTEDFDFAFITAMRARGAQILNAYARKVSHVTSLRPEGWKMPIFCVDYGFFRRVYGQDDFASGYWQVSLGGLNRVPTFYCPPNRWDALELDVHEKGGDPKGYVLVCGQHADDPSHGMSANALSAWADVAVNRFSVTGRPVVYRPHPDSPDILPTVPCRISETGRGTLTQALEEASLLVTVCGNSGHDALLAGVPAIATMPERAAWCELSGADLPSVRDRTLYFQRVACAQWRMEELRNGQWFKYYKHIEGKADPFGPAPEFVPTADVPEEGDRQAVMPAALQRPRGRTVSTRR